MNEETNTPEPLAAILAVMRKRAQEAHDGLNGERDQNQIDCTEVEDWCARIDAAVERERVEIRRDAEIEWTRIGYDERKAEDRSGNSAVTREALMKAKLYFDHRGEGTNLDDAGMAIDAITSIDEALAAPARNCDRFATHNEARAAFLRSYFGPNDSRSTSCRRRNAMPSPELKPCPFCGRGAKIHKHPIFGYYVSCNAHHLCGAKTRAFEEEKSAVATWNRRSVAEGGAR